VSSSELVRAASAPCLTLREEEIPAVQEKIRSHVWARDAYQKLLDSARTRVATRVRIPDRGGQWPHWYACQECGHRLVTESPTVHRCPSCDLVNSGEPWDSVPLTQVHNSLSESVRSLGVCYALSGESQFAEKAAEILLGYSELYPKYLVRDHNLETDTAWATKVSWGTLGESVWLIPVCAGYDLIRHADVLSPAEHQAIREQLLRPAAQLILKHNIGIHNIQCWHNCAIGMAALMLRDTELLSFAVEGDVGITEQLAQGVRADGLWHEGSWGYHFYGLTPLLDWAVALRNCGFDLFRGGLRSMFEAPLKAVRPDGGMPAFHDSGGPSLTTRAHQYEVALAAFDDPQFAGPIHGSSRDSLAALLHGVPELPPADPPIISSTLLSSSGYAHARQGKGDHQTYVGFDYGPHGGGHGHPDKLGFTLFARGKTQAPDPGSVAYGTPIHQKWYKQTLSHNTVVVDGQSQDPATGELNFMVTADGMDILQADAGAFYEGVRMNRTMVVTEGTILIVDRVRSNRAHTYDWVYHNRGKLNTGFKRRKLRTPLHDGEGFDVIQDLRRGQPEDEWRATFRQEDSGVRLIMAKNRGTDAVYTGVGPANIDSLGIGFEAEEVPFVIARRNSRRTTFASALQIFGSRPSKDSLVRVPVEKPDQGRAFHYTCGKTDLMIVVSFKPGFMTCEDIRFRGAAALVDRSDANRVILCSGDSVTCFGHQVSVKPAGSVEVASDDSGLRVTNRSDEAATVSVDDRSTSLPAGRTWRVPVA
jgi:hypothetical protein